MAKAQTYDYFNPSVWSPKMELWFEARLKAAKFFTDQSSDVARGGDKVWVPKVGQSFTVGDIPSTSGAVSATDVDDTKTALTLDQWKGAAFYVTDMQDAQALSSYNVKKKYAQKMAYDLATDYDSVLMHNAENMDSNVGDSVSQIGATTIEKAISLTESANVPRNELGFFFNPATYWESVMNVQKYYDASQFGKASVPQGAHGMLYGIPTYVTSQVVATAVSTTNTYYENWLAHPDNIVHARSPIGYNERAVIRLQEKTGEDLRVKVIGDVLYGQTTLKTGAGVEIYDAAQ